MVEVHTETFPRRHVLYKAYLVILSYCLLAKVQGKENIQRNGQCRDDTIRNSDWMF